MLKHYIRYQIRHWWPLLLIFGITLVLIYSLGCTLTSVSYTVYKEGSVPHYAGLGQFFSPLLALLIPALALAFLMPLFIYHYRTKKQYADVYSQASYDPTTVKRVHFVIGLIILLIAVTGAFIIGTTIFLTRYYTTPEVWTRTSNPNAEYHRYDLNIAAFFLGYLVTIFAVAAQYSINCFLVGLGNYVLDQIMLLVFGNLILALCFLAPIFYIVSLYNRAGNTIPAFVGSVQYYSFALVGPITFQINIIEPLIQKVAFSTDTRVFTATNSAIAFALNIICGGVCAFVNAKLPDPSGEFADVAGARNKAIALIPHGAALLLGIVFATTMTLGVIVLTTFFTYALYAIIYYCVLALWRHSFKPTRFDLICYLSVVIGVLTLTVIGVSVTSIFDIPTRSYRAA